MNKYEKSIMKLLLKLSKRGFTYEDLARILNNCIYALQDFKIVRP
jgi:hypothetical protein